MRKRVARITMNHGTLPIGLVAARAGVSVRAVRYYEQRGLLRAAARHPTGYRRFDPRTVDAVRWIQQALRMGFHVGEIRALLDDTHQDRGRRTSSLRERALAKVRQLDAEVARLTRARRTLLALAECSCGTRGCEVLAAVEATGPPTARCKERKEENGLAGE